MKKSHYLLLFLLIPQFMYAVFFIKDHEKILDKMTIQWNRHNMLLEQFGNLPDPWVQGENIQILQEAVVCCQLAIQYCDKILEKIEEKPRADRKSWTDIKKLRKADKKRFGEEIERIQRLIDEFPFNAYIFRINHLYQTSLKKGETAAEYAIWSREQAESRESRLEGLHQAIEAYNEAITCYQQALLFSEEYFPGQPLHIDEKIVQAFEAYQKDLKDCQREAEKIEASI